MLRMGKLMKSVLTSVLVSAVVGNQNFEVYSCNNDATRVRTDREIYFVQKHKFEFFSNQQYHFGYQQIILRII